MKKQYCKTPDEIVRMLPSLGGAIVTDRVAVDGAPVGYMERSEPTEQADSGWAFYAGDESQGYLDDPNNASLMDLNTIANFDHGILPFLMFPPGTQIERGTSGELEPVGQAPEAPPVRFLLPAFPGVNSLTKAWEVNTQEHMLRRVENGDLVMWRPGLTFYVTCFSSNDQDERELVADFTKDISPGAQCLSTNQAKGFTQISYRLIEQVDGHEQKGVYINGFAGNRVIYIAAYYDQESDLAVIESLADSLRIGG